MSTYHFSFGIPETTPCWTHQHHQSLPFPFPTPIQNQNSSSSGSPIQLYQQTTSTCLNSHSTNSPFNLNHDQHGDDEDEDNVAQPVAVDQPSSQHQKEPMFEKPLTPSDVGKLNRLVIPKQHAEKYFPLGDSPESRGLLLSFEDESGKCWRFRYSYWNSSQSYVLTKGWSRYVKDKRLDAGDVVLFERHRMDSQRLFINWRRRQQNATAPAQVSRAASGNSNNGVGLGWTRHVYAAHPYPTHHKPLTYQPECLHADTVFQSHVDECQTTSPVVNSSRVLRLFGVNMECQEPDESVPGSEYSYLSSTQEQGTPTHQYFYHQQASYPPNPHSTHLIHQLPFC